MRKLSGDRSNGRDLANPVVVPDHPGLIQMGGGWHSSEPNSLPYERSNEVALLRREKHVGAAPAGSSVELSSTEGSPSGQGRRWGAWRCTGSRLSCGRWLILRSMFRLPVLAIIIVAFFCLAYYMTDEWLQIVCAPLGGKGCLATSTSLGLNMNGTDAIDRRPERSALNLSVVELLQLPLRGQDAFTKVLVEENDPMFIGALDCLYYISRVVGEGGGNSSSSARCWSSGGLVQQLQAGDPKPSDGVGDNGAGGGLQLQGRELNRTLCIQNTVAAKSEERVAIWMAGKERACVCDEVCDIVLQTLTPGVTAAFAAELMVTVAGPEMRVLDIAVADDPQAPNPIGVFNGSGPPEFWFLRWKPRVPGRYRAMVRSNCFGNAAHQVQGMPGRHLYAEFNIDVCAKDAEVENDKKDRPKERVSGFWNLGVSSSGPSEFRKKKNRKGRSSNPCTEGEFGRWRRSDGGDYEWSFHDCAFDELVQGNHGADAKDGKEEERVEEEEEEDMADDSNTGSTAVTQDRPQRHQRWRRRRWASVPSFSAQIEGHLATYDKNVCEIVDPDMEDFLERLNIRGIHEITFLGDSHLRLLYDAIVEMVGTRVKDPMTDQYIVLKTASARESASSSASAPLPPFSVARPSSSSPPPPLDMSTSPRSNTTAMPSSSSLPLGSGALTSDISASADASSSLSTPSSAHPSSSSAAMVGELRLNFFWVDGIYLNGEFGCWSRGSASHRPSFPPNIPRGNESDVVVMDAGAWTWAFCKQAVASFDKHLPEFLDWVTSVVTKPGVRRIWRSATPITPQYWGCNARTNHGMRYANDLARRLTAERGINFFDAWHIEACLYLHDCARMVYPAWANNVHYTCLIWRDECFRVTGPAGRAAARDFAHYLLYRLP
ncbi:hypothetical protein CBR_g26204 [Chara braunii]|uniref:Uncharacterized protein n=1 Tax=Chara braunii TaxID=69332 RepID=A0A388L772_CHABU|nr:hypothetical protein CBR_g26204 [Chara braunii]|eukprot:GBG78171.1 hypothetical protein CBR_g26204 [Chara braunii]